MRPYWAVLKDSFREAMASRVLAILLAISTLALAFLVAPLSVEEEPVPVTSAEDFFDPGALAREWAAEQDSDRATPAKHLWSLLSEKEREKVAAWGNRPMEASEIDELAGLFERLMTRTDLYDAGAWKNVEVSKTATEALAGGAKDLSSEELRRANRLVLESAFRGKIVESHADALYLSYFGWSFGRKFDFDIQRHDLERTVQTILGSVMSFFVGTLGVFGAILVTSTFVPQMLEAGSVDLLFSKPVSRSLLFLNRFLGAGAFIGLNAAYFIGGLWLLAGLRFGVWSGRLWLCIPLFLFAFLVYYSVSAWAGVVWRNAIVAVILCVLFWLACFGIQFTQALFEQFAIGPNRLVKVTPLGEGMAAVNTAGSLLIWDEAAGEWKERESNRDSVEAQPPGNPGFRRPPIGPLYDPRGQRLLNIESRGGDFIAADAKNDWRERRIGEAPEGAASLFLNRQGDVLAVGRRGVFRLEGTSRFESAMTDRLSFTFPTAAIDRGDDVVYVYSRGSLYRLTPDDEGRYTLGGQVDLETSERGVMAAAGGSVLLALENGRVLVLDGATLKTRLDESPEKRTPPRFAYSSSEGKLLGVLFHNQTLWIYDPAGERMVRAPVGRQGKISSAAFDGDRLLVAESGRRIRIYDASDFSVRRTLSPRWSGWERAYYYVVEPLYKFFPIPARLEEVMQYLLLERSTQEVPGDDDLSVAQVQVEVARPLLTNAAFMAVVLALTCLYISRKDF